MIKKLTYADVAAQFTRTSAALPDADWNDDSKPKLTDRQKVEALDKELQRTGLDDSIRASLIAERAKLVESKLPLEDPKIAVAFVGAKQEAPRERRARATWGPTQLTTGSPLVYAPRWKTDHHPWVTDAGRHDHQSAQIRYANHEVEEVQA